MSYAWLIISGNSDIGLEDDVGVTGPSNASEEMLEQLKQDDGDGVLFRMKDDDGILYYEGLIIGDYSGFEPFLWMISGCPTLAV